MSAKEVSRRGAAGAAPASSALGRALAMGYGGVSYIIFLLSFLYLVGFVGNLVVPKAIDSGTPIALTGAITIDVLVLGLFAAQHSVMARPGFKAWWTQVVPRPIERSTYMLFTCAALILMVALWRPITTPVWSVEQPVLHAVILGLFAAGWLLVFFSTFMINHFDLFGLRQVYLNLRSKEYRNPDFRITALYRFVRHPLLLGFLISFWAAPVMTVGHLLFTGVMTLYILIAIRFEERDLIKTFGDQYVQYKRTTGMLFPVKTK